LHGFLDEHFLPVPFVIERCRLTRWYASVQISDDRGRERLDERSPLRRRQS